MMKEKENSECLEIIACNVLGHKLTVCYKHNPEAVMAVSAEEKHDDLIDSAVQMFSGRIIEDNS